MIDRLGAATVLGFDDQSLRLFSEVLYREGLRSTNTSPQTH